MNYAEAIFEKETCWLAKYFEELGLSDPCIAYMMTKIFRVGK